MYKKNNDKVVVKIIGDSALDIINIKHIINHLVCKLATAAVCEVLQSHFHCY